MNAEPSWNDLLKRAGIETVETGRKTSSGLPEKALTNGTVCIYRPQVWSVRKACIDHFGVDPLAV